MGPSKVCCIFVLFGEGRNVVFFYLKLKIMIRFFTRSNVVEGTAETFSLFKK